jgi:hypothetical protein
MRIDPQAEIAGMPAIEVRDFLRRARGYELRADPIQLVLECSKDEASAMLARLEEAGILRRLPESPAADPRYAETERGGSIRMATAAKPIKRETADRLLEGLRERAEHLADWSRHPYAWRARSIYVYGSYLRPEVDRLSDVDLAVEWEPRFSDRAAQSDFTRERVRQLRREGREFGSWYRELTYPFTECLFYLRARKAALSFHRTQDGDDWAWLAERPHHLWWVAPGVVATPISELAQRRWPLASNGAR